MAATRREAEVKEPTWGWWLLVLVGLLSFVAGLIILSSRVTAWRPSR